MSNAVNLKISDQNPKVHISLNLPKDLRDRVSAAADDAGLSMNRYIVLKLRDAVTPTTTDKSKP